MSEVREGSLRFDLSVRRAGSGAKGCVPQMRLFAKGAGLREPWETPAFTWPENTEGGSWEEGVKG